MAQKEEVTTREGDTIAKNMNYITILMWKLLRPDTYPEWT
jgi:hypothetical protein